MCINSYDKKLELVQEIKSQDDEFLMIGRRNLKTMNSWMHNVEFLWRKKQEPKLFINPKDAEKLNLDNDELVTLENENGSVNLPLQIIDEVLPNILCYPHGWGHKNKHLSFANQHPGENINVLTSSDKLDSLSGMPVLNGYKVILRKIK